MEMLHADERSRNAERRLVFMLYPPKSIQTYLASKSIHIISCFGGLAVGNHPLTEAGPSSQPSRHIP